MQITIKGATAKVKLMSREKDSMENVKQLFLQLWRTLPNRDVRAAKAQAAAAAIQAFQSTPLDQPAAAEEEATEE